MNIPVLLLMVLYSLVTPKMAPVFVSSPVAEDEGDEMRLIGTMKLRAPEEHNSTMIIEKYDLDHHKQTAEILYFHYQVDDEQYSSHLEGFLYELCTTQRIFDGGDYYLVYYVSDTEAKYQGQRICRIPPSYAKAIEKYAQKKEGKNAVLLSKMDEFRKRYKDEDIRKAAPIFDDIHYLIFKNGKKEYITPPSESPAYKRR